MKRTKLLQELADIAKAAGLSLDLIRHGGNHDIYQIGDFRFPVARHPDVPEQTAKATIKKAEAQQ